MSERASCGEREGRNEWPEGEAEEIQAGARQELPFPEENSCGINVLAELRVLTLPAGLEQLWHQVGAGLWRREGDAQSSLSRVFRERWGRS